MIELLTHNNGGIYCYPHCTDECEVLECRRGCDYAYTLCETLGSYEDTGLTPEEVKRLQKGHGFHRGSDAPASERLIELAEADKEGRVVIIPKGDYTFTLKKDG